MTHDSTAPRRRTLGALALAACLSSVSFAATPPQRKSAPQKKKPEKVKPGTDLLPGVDKPAGQPVATQLPPSILVRWQGKPGVSRYRLQLATDEKFEDVVFDQAVEGRQYVVKDLPPGNYFWRVAPAAAETSVSYSRPERVSLGGEQKVAESSVVLPADATGWRIATGEVVRLTPASLRPGGVWDFVGLGADGRVFAVDGASGISLWTSRYNSAAGAQAPDAKAVTFGPLVLGDPQRGASVIVATQGGVRALLGDTGREMWRSKLEGRAASGVATDMNGDGTPELVVVTEDPEMFYVINPNSGRVLASQKLSGAVAGAPYAFSFGDKRGVLLGLREGGRVEFRGGDGQLFSESKLEGEVTTAPLVTMRGATPFMAVGSDNGLWAFSVPELRALGAIKADDDSVRGALAAADVDGDGSSEIVMVTRRGRVALVSTLDGNVRWYAEGANDASSAAFADLNADGVLDVIVPGGGTTFALAYSGRDGALVMRVEEGGKAGAGQKDAAPRSLVVAPALGGGGLLVGGDTARTGLRAVELPKGSVRTAAK
ncbi:MAG: PQQ-binding-like beta-propeller repeat protein [Acidobacteria bacterium]|nr:PQQ-binding-like beta-propeller repeat protein [Acidobacteriota bacterium]